MKHSIDELLSVVYRFYRHAKSYDDVGDDTEELVAARRHAGSKEPYEQWRAMLRRLQARFPERVVSNQSLHLPTGSCDACYMGRLYLSPNRGEKSRDLGFVVSFLVPYYAVYTYRIIPLGEHERADPEYPSRHLISFAFTADEEPYVKGITAEIEATYRGYEPMPPEVGNIIMPDVFVGTQSLGKATLFHCLFTDAW